MKKTYMIDLSSNRCKVDVVDLEKKFKELYPENDYSQTKFVNMKTSFIVNCNLHGEFKKTPQSHLSGSGCPVCLQIQKYGKPNLSEENVNEPSEFMKNYLKTNFPKFNRIKIIGKNCSFHCELHGPKINRTLTCNECNTQYVKDATITKFINHKELAGFECSHINDGVSVKCEHTEILYNNKQLYNLNINLCDECKAPHYKKTNGDKIKEEVLRRFPNYKFDILPLSYSPTCISAVCKDHGEFSLLPSNMLKGQGCSRCSQITSKAEMEILEFIGDNAIQSCRDLIKPLEIDVLSHNHKFGVEYDGLMYHSSGISSSAKFNKNDIDIRNKHLHKTIMSESKGYQLFHIFENEWIEQKDIWKSIISNKMNKSERIFARKCEIREVSNKLSSEFLKTNHMQGTCNSKVKIGLFYNNELVSLMTFGKSRFNSSFEYELIRYCTKLNTTIVGGGSKLLKYFERNFKPTSIISYANRRWSQGNVYEKLGFEFIEDVKPNYFYFKPNENILYSRNKFQKHKLPQLLEKFNKHMTETQNMFENGYRKIFDCGNKKYIKEYNY